MSATRTQVYFTEEQRRRLDVRAEREGKSLAEVVREAVDGYLVQEPPALATVLDESFASMPDIAGPPRSEWDRDHA